MAVDASAPAETGQGRVVVPQNEHVRRLHEAKLARLAQARPTTQEGAVAQPSSLAPEPKPRIQIVRSAEEQAAFDAENFPQATKGAVIKHARRPWGSVEARAMERGRMILQNELKRGMAAGRELLENAFREEIDASTPKPAEPPTAPEPRVKPKRKTRAKPEEPEGEVLVKVPVKTKAPTTQAAPAATETPAK